MAVLFFDIDGTLVDGDKRVSESTMKSLRKAKQGGHLLFVNTGRTICDVPKELKEVPFDGCCCGCGTYIAYGEQLLFQHTIPAERGAEIIKYMKEHGIAGILESSEDIYFQEEPYRNVDMEDFRGYVAKRSNGFVRSIEESGMRFDKFIFDVEDSKIQADFVEFLKPDIRVIDWGTGVYECIQKEYSKATAIQLLQEYLKLPEEEIYVFGDSANDIDMFECVKHTIAMGKHDKVLEPVTEYVTDTVEGEGIRKALEHYGLI